MHTDALGPPGVHAGVKLAARRLQVGEHDPDPRILVDHAADSLHVLLRALRRVLDDGVLAVRELAEQPGGQDPRLGALAVLDREPHHQQVVLLRQVLEHVVVAGLFQRAALGVEPRVFRERVDVVSGSLDQGPALIGLAVRLRLVPCRREDVPCLTHAGTCQDENQQQREYAAQLTHCHLPSGRRCRPPPGCCRRRG